MFQGRAKFKIMYKSRNGFCGNVMSFLMRLESLFQGGEISAYNTALSSLMN